MSDSSVEKFTGRVKWFNNKAGYGFITVTDGSKSGSDVFVHHSSIKVDSEQYKYLVQGEYIEFALSTVASDKHECQATDVSGIKGGKLMCETRNETRVAYKKENEQETSEPVKMPRPKRIPTQSEPPVAKSDSAWTHVKSTRPNVTGAGGRGGRGAGRGAAGGRGATGRGQKRDTV
jgi:CspA family cold shock protein